MKSLDTFGFLVLIGIVLVSLAFYGCGGGGGDNGNSGGESAVNLSRINGRVTDVVAFNFRPESSVFAKLKGFFEVTKTANAQSGSLAGIVVLAVQVQGVEEVVVDEDTTDGNGSFTLDVPPGEIILQFLVGQEIIDILLDVPEDSTVKITVNINANDTVSPVEIDEMDVIDNMDDDQDDGQGGGQSGNNEGNNQGDGDDDDMTGNDPTPSNLQPPPPSGGNGTTVQQMLAVVNNVRAQGRNCGGEFFPGAPPLTWNGTIADSALLHSTDMAVVLEDLTHAGSDGSSAGTRLTNQGYNWRAWGENIAFTGGSSGTAASAVNLWVASPGHCRNMMNPAYTEMGAATASGFHTGFQSNGDFWTLVMADSF